MTTDVISLVSVRNFSLTANTSVQPTEYYTLDPVLNFTSEPALNSSESAADFLLNSTRKRGRTRGARGGPAYIRRDVFLYVAPIIFLFGNVGNGISFFVLRSGELKKLPMCFYLSVLAVSDTGMKASGFFIEFIEFRESEKSLKHELGSI